MNQYAVNPKTGEVLELKGDAWSPVDKSHVAKNAAGEVRVFDGESWKPVQTNSPLAGDKIQAQQMDEARAYNPTPTERMGDLARARQTGTAEPKLPDNASMWARAVDWLQGLGDATGVAAHGMTAGLTDEAGGLGSGVGSVLATDDLSSFPGAFKSGMDAVNANNARFKQNNPRMGSALEGVGLFTSPLFRVGEAWQAAAPTMAGRAVRSGVIGTGAGAGTAAAYNEGDIADRMRAAAFGGATGGALGVALPPLIESVAQGGQAVTKAIADKKQAAPTVDAIKAAATAEYDKAGAAGLILKPDPVVRLQQSIEGELANFGYHPELQPKIAVVLKELDRVKQGNATAQGIDTMRKIALTVARSSDPSERALGGMVVGKIDDMMENLSAGDIVQGNATQATESLAKGRDLWKTMRKADLIDETVKNAVTKAKTQNSGGNIQNTIRQDLRRIILQNPKNARAFTPDELKMIQRIADGTKVENVLRTVGRLAPSSNIGIWGPLFTTLGIGGYAAGNLPGAVAGVAVPAVGSGAKALTTRSTTQAAKSLSDTIKQGAYRSAPQLNPAPAFPLQVRQQLINQYIRERLGLTAPSVSGPVGGLFGADQ